jgi:lysophospholipase L1-like esterase
VLIPFLAANTAVLPRTRAVCVSVLALLLTACGDSPTAPDPPGPVIGCPADIQALAHNGQQTTVVTYTRPVAQGGIAPVTVACTPDSGSAFPLGTNSVTCTASDAQRRASFCSFRIIVTAVPRLTELEFLAFGDSITEGKTSPDPTTLLLNFPDSYPNKLHALLMARYIDQNPTVVPEGLGGELLATQGKKRFPTVLDKHRPDVVLLLHGANDLLAAGDSGDPFDAVNVIIDALDDLIELSHRRRIPVMVATFPPQNVAGSRGAGAPAVPTLNREIARLARSEGAVLVDLFNGLGGTPTGWVGVDGLHPTAAGYTRIAEIWFEAIKQEYEQTPAQ